MAYLSRTSTSQNFSRISPLLRSYLYSVGTIRVQDSVRFLHFFSSQTTSLRYPYPQGHGPLRTYSASSVTSSVGLSLVTSVFATPRARPANEHDNPSEDAYFIAPLPSSTTDSSLSSERKGSSTSRNNVVLVGIADGVGSWQGIVDPKLYPTALMRNACTELLQDIDSTTTNNNTNTIAKLDYLPRLLQRTWERTTKEKIEGSSTITLVSFNGDQRTLQINNLGDCQVLVLRKGTTTNGSGNYNNNAAPYQILYRTVPQTKRFNLPYQVGYSNNTNNQPYFDLPNVQEQYVWTIKEEDIILISSDGMFDNLFDNDILTIINPFYRSLLTTEKNESWVQRLTKQIVTVAREYSLNRRRDGPFAIEAKDNDILWSLGGRPDDITVILGYVTSTVDSNGEVHPPSEIPSTVEGTSVPETLTIGNHLISLIPQNQFSFINQKG